MDEVGWLTGPRAASSVTSTTFSILDLLGSSGGGLRRVAGFTDVPLMMSFWSPGVGRRCANARNGLPTDMSR